MLEHYRHEQFHLLKQSTNTGQYSQNIHQVFHLHGPLGLLYIVLKKRKADVIRSLDQICKIISQAKAQIIHQ